MREREKIPAITSLDIAVGKRKITNAYMDRFIGAQRPGTVDRLMQRVGIKERYWVQAGKQATADLCVEALDRTITRRGINKSEITALWIGTSSPDYLSVSVAAMVQEKLGLPTNILGSNNADACPGWIHAAYRAITNLTSRYGRGGVQAAIGAEVISQSLSRKKGVVSVLFGDGAGATLFENVEPDLGVEPRMGFDFGIDGKYGVDYLGVKAGGSMRRPSHGTIRRDEHGIGMNGPVIFEQAVLRMTQMIKGALKDAGLPIEEVDWFAFHQANGEILKATAEALSIPQEKVLYSIDRYGNTSAASIPIALYEGEQQGKIKRNHNVAGASFGAGLVFAGFAFPMVGLPRKK